VLLIRDWPFAESAILGLLGVVVAVVCLPGILFFTKPLNDPEEMTSEVYVFATGTPAQRLSVDVILNPTNGYWLLPGGRVLFRPRVVYDT